MKIRLYFILVSFLFYLLFFSFQFIFHFLFLELELEFGVTLNFIVTITISYNCYNLRTLERIQRSNSCIKEDTRELDRELFTK